MPLRFTIFISLLFIKVIVAPLWFANNCNEIKNPLEAFEHIRLHKRRSSFCDDVLCEEATIVTNVTQKVIQRVIALISVLILFQKNIPLPYGDERELVSTPLFLRNRVLRI